MINQERVFPISGDLRIPLLIIEWFLIFIFFELTLVFISKLLSEKKKGRGRYEKAYTWLFFGYSIMWFFIVIGDFYITDELIRTFILNIGYLFLISFTFIFVLIVENYITFLFKRLFSVIFSIIISFYIITFIFFLEYGAIVSSISWIPFMLLFFGFTREIYAKYYSKKNITKYHFAIYLFVIGIVLVAVGYLFTTRIMVYLFSLSIRFIGDIFQLIGALSFIISLFLSPNYSEYDWKDHLKYILVLHESGLLIFKKSYEKFEIQIEDSTFAGLIVSIKIMLDKISDSEGISIIKRGENYIIIYPSMHIYGVLISDLKIKTLELLLKKYTDKIEFIFREFLINWDGNLQSFKPIEDLTKTYFS